MKNPTDDEIQRLVMRHWDLYNPVKAHDYYERHKHLKGRRHGKQKPQGTQQLGNAISRSQARRIHNSPKHQQKIALKNAIQHLESKLGDLEALIKKKEALLKKDQAANKHKARHKKGTPKTAVDKAKAAKKYRQSHRQKLKNQAKQHHHAKSGGGSGHGGKGGKGSNSPQSPQQKLSKMPIADLKALATKVKGQIAMAKQKLAAL
jgi:vacuolar-type H+-ATPase subunit I/STV1